MAYLIRPIYPEVTFGIFGDDDQLLADGFYTWRAAELAALHLDAIADCGPGDVPLPDEPIPENVGDEPPPHS